MQKPAFINLRSTITVATVDRTDDLCTGDSSDLHSSAVETFKQCRLEKCKQAYTAPTAYAVLPSDAASDTVSQIKCRPLQKPLCPLRPMICHYGTAYTPCRVALTGRVVICGLCKKLSWLSSMAGQPACGSGHGSLICTCARFGHARAMWRR